MSERMIRTSAVLRVAADMGEVDLYLPEPVWKELTARLKTNRLTVVLRMSHEEQRDWGV